MKKFLNFLVLLLISINTYSQTSGNIANSINVPTSVNNPNVLIGANPVPSGQWKVYIKDDIRWETYNINGFNSQVSTITGSLYKPIGYTPSYSEIIASLSFLPYNSSNPSGYISTEYDPIWTAVESTYRTKLQNDGLYQAIGSYLTSESDPTVPAYSKSLSTFNIIKSSTDPLYEPIFSKNTAFNKNFGTTAGTIVEGNDSRVLNAQTAFGWGNHSTFGYLTSTSTNTLTNKSGNVSQWTNDSGYLTAVTSGQITTALGFTPITNARTLTINGTTQDLSANRSWSVGDVLLSGSYTNPSWITSLAYSKLIGVPTTIGGFGITDFNSLGDARWSLLGHTHTFSSLTSKPTTLNGYGITDGYPLTGNPSGFLTSFTEVDPTVPNYSKSLTAFSIIKASTDPLYKTIGYTPTSGEITTALGFTPYNVTNPNGYISNLSTFTTSNLTEGTNLYYTQSRFSTAFSAKTTTDLAEGTNLYYTDNRSRSSISLTTTGSGSATYNNVSGVINIPTPPTALTAGTGISIASNIVTNTAPDQTVVLTAGNRISITGTYPNFTIAYVEPTINIVARTLNSNFTISTTKQALVTYSVTCSVTNPLLVGTSTAMAYLEYSTNAGSTWLLPSQNGNSSGVGITVTLQLTNGQTGTLIGYIPANALVRIRTTTSGTASVTYVTGQENY